jgi:hypothetical protein
MRTHGCRLSCFLLLSLWSAVFLKGSGQAPQEKPAAAQIRVHTGEVVVDVNVTDGEGKPIRGLTESDFAVYEDSVKQQIASFRFISPTTPEPSPPLRQDPGKTTLPSELAADTPGYPHLISLVFDKVNANGAEASRAASAARTYEGVNILPDLSAVYRKSTDKELTVYFVVQANTASPQIQATLEFLGDGAPNAKLRRTLPPPDEAGRIRCITRVGLDPFKPGKYELRVTVTDASRSASGIAQFRVER